MVIHRTIILFYLYQDRNIEGTATSKNIKSKRATKKKGGGRQPKPPQKLRNLKLGKPNKFFTKLCRMKNVHM